MDKRILNKAISAGVIKTVKMNKTKFIQRSAVAIVNGDLVEVSAAYCNSVQINKPDLAEVITYKHGRRIRVGDVDIKEVTFVSIGGEIYSEMPKSITAFISSLLPVTQTAPSRAKWAYTEGSNRRRGNIPTAESGTSKTMPGLIRVAREYNRR